MLENEVDNEGVDSEKHVKILFRFYSELFEEEMVETLWALKIDEELGLYQIDNIPFYVPLLASEDIVYAEHDSLEDRLVYRKTIKDSGNSTIHVVMLDENVDINTICDEFFDLECSYEGVNESYFAMEVPKTVNYKPIKERLEQLELQGQIGYAESCLSELHCAHI